ncbi:hypothetical protein DY240_11250 [Jiangella rhizosphaerae]|uniref:Capsular polysaccharide biosynthesis protein n=1 Tax=Jiangella rhizosphaerae TaxID=2293569 RepID=A0A418KSB8_9ACTN|nr:hypothetical protein DY240_11250 [Jiangella rhizosphaerae]
MRRWYVLLPLLALTGVLALQAGDRVAPEYEGQAGAMITPERVQGEVANPYGSITNANEALGIVLNSVDSRRTIVEQGLSASYEIGVASRSTILQVSVRADSPEVAVATGQAVLDLAAQELATRQTEAGLPPEAQYTLAILDPPAVTAIVNTGSVRVQAVVGILGAGLSLLVAVLFDDIVGLWKRARAKGARRSAKRAREEKDTAEATEAATEAAVEDPAQPSSSTVDEHVPATDEPETPRPRDLPRRRSEPAAAGPHGPKGNGNGHTDHAGLTTASPSINSALINTNEWVWPGDQGLEEALEAAEEPRRRRNPFFDPEFTKRQLQKKSKRTDPPASAEDESTSGTTTSSGAARRP